MQSVKAWLAAMMMMTVASAASAVEMPTEEAFRQQCQLGALEEGVIAADADGTVWLLEGPWVLAHVETGERLWMDRTTVRCEGTVASITSQGQGTFVVTMLELDFQDFLPEPVKASPAAEPAPTTVAAR